MCGFLFETKPPGSPVAMGNGWLYSIKKRTGHGGETTPLSQGQNLVLNKRVELRRQLHLVGIVPHLHFPVILWLAHPIDSIRIRDFTDDIRASEVWTCGTDGECESSSSACGVETGNLGLGGFCGPKWIQSPRSFASSKPQLIS